MFRVPDTCQLLRREIVGTGAALPGLGTGNGNAGQDCGNCASSKHLSSSVHRSAVVQSNEMWLGPGDDNQQIVVFVVIDFHR